MLFAKLFSNKITNNRIPDVAIAILFGLGLAFFGEKKGLADIPLFSGLAILGGSMLRDFSVVATAMGADLNKIKQAGLAGVIAGPVLTTFPGMATVLGSIVFVIVVIGGLGSLAGAFIASLLIGLLQSYAIASDVGMPDLLNLLGISFERSHPLNDLWTMNLPQIAPVLPYLLLVLVLDMKKY